MTFDRTSWNRSTLRGIEQNLMEWDSVDRYVADLWSFVDIIGVLLVTSGHSWRISGRWWSFVAY